MQSPSSDPTVLRFVSNVADSSTGEGDVRCASAGLTKSETGGMTGVLVLPEPSAPIWLYPKEAASKASASFAASSAPSSELVGLGI